MPATFCTRAGSVVLDKKLGPIETASKSDNCTSARSASRTKPAKRESNTLLLDRKALAEDGASYSTITGEVASAAANDDKKDTRTPRRTMTATKSRNTPTIKRRPSNLRQAGAQNDWQPRFAGQQQEPTTNSNTDSNNSDGDDDGGDDRDSRKPTNVPHEHWPANSGKDLQHQLRAHGQRTAQDADHSALSACAKPLKSATGLQRPA